MMESTDGSTNKATQLKRDVEVPLRLTDENKIISCVYRRLIIDERIILIRTYQKLMTFIDMVGNEE